MSPRSRTRPRSAIGLASDYLPAGPSATARSSALTIPCAAAIRWSKCGRPALSIQKESAAVPSRPFHATSALAGLAVPGVYGKEGCEPGVAIDERTGLGLATVAAGKGEAEALRQTVASAYGVELPDRSRAVHGPSVSFIGYGPGQWLAVSETVANERLARELGDRLRGLGSDSGQSGGRTVLRISGPG